MYLVEYRDHWQVLGSTVTNLHYLCDCYLKKGHVSILEPVTD
jgi:hypothetical protein